MKLLVIVERTESGYSAFAPDLPGCIATGSSRATVENRMHQAVELHLAGLREEGITPPDPQTYATTIEVAA